MRKIFEHPAYYEVGLLESKLNSHGIETLVKNTAISTVGGIPFTASYPELWVLHDTQYDEALALLQEYKANLQNPAPGPDWICVQCGESVPGTFDFCWNCQDATGKPTWHA